MSFNNYDDIENAADARSLHYKDFPEFESLSQQIESTLYNVNNNQLTSLKNLTNQYDSLFNAEEDATKPTKLNKLGYTITGINEKITKNYKTINDLTQKVNNYLNECEANHEDQDSVSYLRQKESLLIKLVKSSLKTYQGSQRRYEIMQKKTVEKYGSQTQAAATQTTQTAATAEETDPQTQSQSQVQLGSESQQVQISYEPVNAEELEQQTLLIQEREREIEQISQDITYINEIYSNLDDIVHEQQFAIDSIEDNVLRYSDDVHGASNELRRAERYQRRSSGRMLCCLFILLGILGFIIIIGLIF